jgi:hypothetical protein
MYDLGGLLTDICVKAKCYFLPLHPLPITLTRTLTADQLVWRPWPVVAPGWLAQLLPTFLVLFPELSLLDWKFNKLQPDHSKS